MVHDVHRNSFDTSVEEEVFLELCYRNIAKVSSSVNNVWIGEQNTDHQNVPLNISNLSLEIF